LIKKLEDSNEAATATDKVTEALVVSSAYRTETSQTKELPVIQTKEDVVGKQESVHHDTNSTGLEQKKTESEYVASTAELASLPVSPAIPPNTNAPNRGVMRGQLKE
jgi:hypothetical protein